MVKAYLSNDYKIAVYKDNGGKITQALGVPDDTIGIVVIDTKWHIQGYQTKLTPEIYLTIDNFLK